ncbi:MAG: phage baseplate protein [Romboutsia timonensis]
MAKSVRLKNDLYLDSTSIVHNKKKLSDIFYPIGSVYISVNDVNPATLYGGAWQKVSGYYLLAWDSNYGSMGGKWTTNDTVLTINQIPSHRHVGIYNEAHTAERYGGWGETSTHTGTIYEHGNNQWEHLCTGYTGGTQGHNHYFETPWFKVNVWYRTA